MKYKNIFFIGIGGKGLNGIAQICHQKGLIVSGVDKIKSIETKFLEEKGIKVFYKHAQANLSTNTDVVVYSSIVKSNCPELIAAKKLGIPVMKRSKFLNLLTNKLIRISVAGSHGKSTTTAIAGLSLSDFNSKASIYGGAYINEIDAYNQLGDSNLAVVESCEYDKSFLDLIGDYTIITDLESSHPEFYKNEEEMVKAFKQFVYLHPNRSSLIINGDNLKLRKISTNVRAKVATFGFNSVNDYHIVDMVKKEKTTQFSVKKDGEYLIKDVQVKIPGDYNVKNFTAVIALLDQMGYPLDNLQKVTENFKGVGRRFEVRDVDNHLTFIDDFAHHPTQVKNLMSGIKQFYPDHKICAIFQPRQYKLIKSFLREYGSAFKLANEVIVTDIVKALGDTKKDTNSICSDNVANSIKCYSQTEVKLISDFDKIKQYLARYLGTKTVVATIGAGNVNTILHSFNK